MAAYFPRGQQSEGEIKKKFKDDLVGVTSNNADGIAFVTNQEMTLSERETLTALADPQLVDLYHLEKITLILDTPAMARVRKQFLNIDFEDAPRIVGGQGGLAPGAGGGGGGVIGSSRSRGGDGGPGGKITLDGAPGLFPGAGGGGAGAIGEGSIGGTGGGGGEIRESRIDLEELKIDRAEIQVGQGGNSGEAGGDTIVNFLTADGTVVKTLVAKSGAAGAAGSPAPPRQATPEDVENGLRVVTLLLANSAEIREGLLYLLGAGWEHYEFSGTPFQAQFPLVGSVSTGSLAEGTLLEVSAVVTTPNGSTALSERFVLPKSDSAVSRPSFLVSLRFSGSEAGIWTISIVSGGLTLGELPFEIRLPRPG